MVRDGFKVTHPIVYPKIMSFENVFTLRLLGLLYDRNLQITEQKLPAGIKTCTMEG